MKISVITVNYNNRVGLGQTIISVITQTYPDIEYVIIDGGSTDGSVELIRTYSEKISYWISEPDAGIYNAMNKGIDAISGDYCIFMNSGDVFCNERVIGEVFNKASGSDIICGNTMMPHRQRAPKDITFSTLYSSTICHQCAFIKTTLMKKHMYDDQLKIAADRKFFIKALIFDNCSYESVDVDVVNYDINGYSAHNRFLSEQEHLKVVEELIPERVRKDYATARYGALYGETYYEQLFLEIRKRNYKGYVYTLTVIFLKILSFFKSSAKFINYFPVKLR